MQGIWPRCYFSSHMGGKKLSRSRMGGIVDACVVSPCSEQHLDLLCDSLHQLKTNSSIKKPSPAQHTVLSDARAAAPTPDPLEISPIIKQESKSPRQCPHQQREMRSQTSVKKAPTSPRCMKLPSRLRSGKKYKVFRAQKYPLFSNQLKFRHKNRKLLHF